MSRESGSKAGSAPFNPQDAARRIGGTAGAVGIPGAEGGAETGLSRLAGLSAERARAGLARVAQRKAESPRLLTAVALLLAFRVRPTHPSHMSRLSRQSRSSRGYSTNQIDESDLINQPSLDARRGRPSSMPSREMTEKRRAIRGGKRPPIFSLRSRDSTS